MSPLHSFLEGLTLTEFLIEGHNPYARQKLSTGDVDALRQHMKTGEVLRAFATGRVVGTGPGVWAVTEQQVLIRQAAQHAVVCIHTGDINSFDAQLGRYGHTVQLTTQQGRNFSMYGVDAELAREMHQSLQSLGVRCSFEDKPPISRTWMAHSGPHLSVKDCLDDARQRLLAT